MHLADLDNNGSIDKGELIHNVKASSLLKDYFNTAKKHFLTKVDFVQLIPEVKVLANLVKELETCLSSAIYDPFLLNRTLKAVPKFFK